jgi:hypothetical protein
MVKRTLIAVLAIHMTMGSGCSPNPRSATPDDASVYIAAIEVLFARDTTVRRVALAEEPLSISAGAVRRAAAEIPILAARDAAAPGVANEFVLSTHAPSAADIQLRAKRVATVASRANLVRLRAQADTDAKRAPQRYVTPVEPYWERFYREYAPEKTLVRLAPAAYVRDRQRALVYVTFACGALCGGSYWVLLDRVGGEWRVRHVQRGYVA